MEHTTTVQCPWCFETVEVWIDPDTRGKTVRDCEVCCRPWELTISRDAQGKVQVVVRRGN